MTQVLLEKKRKSLLEDYDYEEKVRILTLKKRIEWFVDNKSKMTQNEKWDAFRDMYDDYDTDWNRLIDMTNSIIRKKGLSVW
jgi:hypothetical protein